MIALVRVENSRSRPRSRVMLATTRDEDGRHRRDHREQRDDPDVQPRRGAAAPAGLHHEPDLAGDDAEQQEDGERVDQQQRDDDLMGRRDRRQVGKHHEGRKGRQQRKAEPRRDRAPAWHGSAAWPRFRQVSVWSTLAILVIMPRQPRLELSTRRPGCAHRNAPAGWNRPTDAFIQQCCPIATFPRRMRERMDRLGRDMPGRQPLVRITWISRSRIFLRSVLRLSPSRSAARIWLPRVAASAADSSGYSTSRRMRW